jgi:hypothetical protein
MEITRRVFLEGATLFMADARQAPREPPAGRTVIETPNLRIAQAADTFVGASVSQTTACQVELLDGFRRRVRVNEWTVEAQTPIGGVAAPLKAGENASGVRITMTPPGGGVPSIAVAIVQPATGDGAARVPTDAGRLQAANLARRARFVDDPARTPGRFIVVLPADGTVSLRVWRGEDASGSPLHQQVFRKVPQGETPIPWDLTMKGARVPAGRYTAVLVCTPDNQALRPTNLISYFAVA